jgi:hypothetical protein
MWSEGPRDIILAGGWSNTNSTPTIERMEIGEEGMILNSQFLLPQLPFMIWSHCAVTLGTIGTDESKGLLIGGRFEIVGKLEWDPQKTIEFELSTMTWDINRPRTKHERWHSSSSILPDGSPAICGSGKCMAITEINRNSRRRRRMEFIRNSNSSSWTLGDMEQQL